MIILRKWWSARVDDKPLDGPTDEDLLAFCDLDPWVLVCAVDYGEGRYGLDFDSWWGLSRDNWMRSARKEVPNLTTRRYEQFLRAFARQNSGKDHYEIISDVARRRGLRPPLIHEGGAMSYPAATEAQQRVGCGGECCRSWNRQQRELARSGQREAEPS